MNTRLKIISKAVLIRINNGEDLNDILESYPALTDADKQTVTEYVNAQLFDNLAKTW